MKVNSNRLTTIRLPELNIFVKINEVGNLGEVKIKDNPPVLISAGDAGMFMFSLNKFWTLCSI